MPGLRDLRKKIDAVKKIGQITKAMNMVASSKLRSLQGRLEGFRPYRQKFEEVLAQLLTSPGLNKERIPYLKTKEIVQRVGLIIITADRGLCGAFNSNIIREAESFIKKNQREGKAIELILVGRKGISYFRKKLPVREVFGNVMGRVLMQDARRISRSAITAYLDGEWDEVYLIYGYFINVIRQVPRLERFLPLSFEVPERTSASSYTYEPDEEELLPLILPQYLNTLIYSAMLETAVSEQAARMTAMDNANRACGDMVKQLTLYYNKVRQASITKELMDIVGGAEAIKG
ncbi:MAG: ATP synthase F1 subunit gamma [Caldimicrobium sp.]|nr:ATP synthase F1 subunit gamma [Caldimicrobium sp.]MCX7873273.1 ATP synthase F1 subunit gamma [Caldimicrobium sp.]MDW8094729.1 ATP synthase F1 subunit gamma [Caldimicrobium sp.]